MNCPRCNSCMTQAISHSNEPSTSFLECPHCNTFVNTWIPQPQQFMFLADPHRFKGNFGAYGSAKTSASIQNILKHIFLTPNGTGLVGANILPQLEQTIKREFDQNVPKAFIQEFNNQKQFYTFINGYRLLWRPLDEAGKLRSLNLDMIVFVEGSEINEDFWSTAKTRLRNMSASLIDQPATNTNIQNFIKRKNRNPTPQEIQSLTVYLADWREQWVESNPDAGWVKQDVFNVASQVYLSGDPLFKPVSQEQLALIDLDTATSVHIASTSANAYLPKDYIKNLVKNKPQWWINRFVLSSFEYAEGLVFPSAINNTRTNTPHILTSPPQPPRQARFLLAHDYGLSDPAGILLAYVDPTTRQLIVYKEYKQQNNHITDLASHIKRIANFAPQGSWLRPFIIDPKSGPKRDYNKQSLIDLYAEHGIHFQPASTPTVEPGIYKLNSYFEDDRILISPECTNLIQELSQYSFKQARNQSNTDTPEDSNNHLIDPLRWIVMELPSDPNNLLEAVYNNYGNRISADSDSLSYGFNALTPTQELVSYTVPTSPSQYLYENSRQTEQESGIIKWNPLD